MKYVYIACVFIEIALLFVWNSISFRTDQGQMQIIVHIVLPILWQFTSMNFKKISRNVQGLEILLLE